MPESEFTKYVNVDQDIDCTETVLDFPMDCNIFIVPATSQSTEKHDEEESNNDGDNDVITAATALNHPDKVFSFVAFCKDADTGLTLYSIFKLVTFSKDFSKAV